MGLNKLHKTLTYHDSKPYNPGARASVIMAC